MPDNLQGIVDKLQDNRDIEFALLRMFNTEKWVHKTIQILPGMSCYETGIEILTTF